MPPRRIMVTGSRGFVGRHLTARLREDLPDATVLETDYDVTDEEAALRTVREAKPDACVHLAAVAAIPAAAKDPARTWQVNLFGTLYLARAIQAHAPDAVMLFASSADAYGASFRAGHPLDESAALAPQNTYGATKAAADLALGAMAAEGLRVVRARAFNHAGAGQSSSFVLPAFAEQIALIAAGTQPPVLRVGSLDAARDFLDVRDVCGAYAACLRRADSLEPGTILNIASGVPRRIGDILADMLRLAGVEAAIERDESRMRRSEIASATGDAGRARALLDWRPSIAWERTLADVLADWRSRAAQPARADREGS